MHKPQAIVMLNKHQRIGAGLVERVAEELPTSWHLEGGEPCSRTGVALSIRCYCLSTQQASTPALRSDDDHTMTATHADMCLTTTTWLH